MHANPFPTSKHHSSHLLELIHSDVHYVNTPSQHGHRYWVTFIDDFSRYRMVYAIKSKSDVFAAFQSFKAYAETQLERKIKCLRDDKGGEYMSNQFDHFLTQAGITRQHTTRNRPQQNGVAERAN